MKVRGTFRNVRRLSGLLGEAAVGSSRRVRSISICYVDENDINSLMVKRGWALAYRKYSKKYVKDEAIAKLNNAGMWSGKFIAPWKWRRMKNKKVR